MCLGKNERCLEIRVSHEKVATRVFFLCFDGNLVISNQTKTVYISNFLSLHTDRFKNTDE